MLHESLTVERRVNVFHHVKLVPRVAYGFEHRRCRAVFLAVIIENVEALRLIRMLRRMLSGRTFAAVHAEDVLISEAQEPRQCQRTNTYGAAASDRPFAVRQDSYAMLIVIEDVPQLDVITLQMLKQLRMAGGRD